MGARDLLHELDAAGFSVRVEDGSVLIKPASKLTDDQRIAIRAAKPELLSLLTTRPYRLSPAEADAAHAEPWNDAAIARFVARVALFLRRGIDATDADDLAERLHLRDVQGDDRRSCLECRHLSGRRCGNAAAAGVGAELPDALVTLMQRCPGFGAA